MPHQLIGIRTNTWTERVATMYRQLQAAFSPESIFVIMDETKGEVPVPDGIQKIGWNQAAMTRWGVLDYNHFNRGIGWLCGDYFYYAFQEAVAADFYWLIEPDVGLHFSDCGRDFFAHFKTSQDPVWLAHYRQLPPDDYWYASACLISHEAYGCLFPLNRLSASAITICLKERQRLSRLFAKWDCQSNTHNPLGTHFPNDEALVVTTLKREGFAIRDFSEKLPRVFDFLGFHHYFGLGAKDELASPRHRVVHPVRPPSALAAKLVGEMITDLEIGGHLEWVTTQPGQEQEVADLVAKELSGYISQELKRLSRHLFNLSDLSRLVAFAAQTSPYPYSCWTYDNRIEVIDVTVHGQVLTTEFELAGQILTAYTFSRQPSRWQSDFLKQHPQFELVDDKVKQFEYRFEDLTELGTAIQAAVQLFFFSLPSGPA